MYMTPEKFKAMAEAGNVFYTFDGEPVKPEPGQWFCEFELIEPEDEEYPPFVRDEALVRFECFDEFVVFGDAGPKTFTEALVWDETADECRNPRTPVLILQS